MALGSTLAQLHASLETVQNLCASYELRATKIFKMIGWDVAKREASARYNPDVGLGGQCRHLSRTRLTGAASISTSEWEAKPVNRLSASFS
jgi:hypothetical protein